MRALWYKAQAANDEIRYCQRPPRSNQWQLINDSVEEVQRRYNKPFRSLSFFDLEIYRS